MYFHKILIKKLWVIINFGRSLTQSQGFVPFFRTFSRFLLVFNSISKISEKCFSKVRLKMPDQNILCAGVFSSKVCQRKFSRSRIPFVFQKWIIIRNFCQLGKNVFFEVSFFKKSRKWGLCQGVRPKCFSRKLINLLEFQRRKN